MWREDAIRNHAKFPIHLPLIVVCSFRRESGALLAQLADRTYDALESGLQETEAGRLKRRAVHEGDSVESASFLTTEINLNSLWASKKGRPSTSLRL